MKLNTFEIRVLVNDLSSFIDNRLIQTYDANRSCDKRAIMLKFSTNEKEKRYMVIDSGIRINNTPSALPKPAMIPSSFVSKLRKHIVNKRLSNITQLGFDRIMDLTFGTDESAYHLILEFYDEVIFY